MIFQPITKEAYRLFHEGQKVLSAIEQHGIRIDREKAKTNSAHITRQIDRIARNMEKYPEIKEWHRAFGSKFNMNSDNQLRHILYDFLKLESSKQTRGGKASVDKSVLQDLDVDFLEDIQHISRLDVVRNNYLKSIIREADDDNLIHPMFELTGVSTFRSGCSHPPFHGFPMRDDEQAAFIRSCIIPRDGFQIGECDFQGAEPRTGCGYHCDPNMIAYQSDETKDLHRDCAMNCFILPLDRMTKKIRYCGKNMFVLPEFYGDYFVSCAISMWKAIKRLHLETADGQPLMEHLADNGIKTYKQFEKHIQGFEDMFWFEWFPDYSKWKDTWYSQYLKRGWFETKTGFRVSGELSKNQVINAPIQGDAFHCLLQILIWTYETLIEGDWKTQLLGQIHDSEMSENWPDELPDYYRLVEDLVCKQLPGEWTWINVPMKFEMEVAPVGKSWFDKKEYVP